MSLPKWLFGLSLLNAGAFAAGVPASLVVGVAPQSTTVGTAFSGPLLLTVFDSTRNPLSGIPITYSAPGGSGPSGTFSNGTGTITVMSNAFGVVSVELTANSIPGTYSVTAGTLTATGILSANFSLTNVGLPAV